MANNLQWNVDLHLNSTPARQQFDKYMADAQKGNEQAMDKVNEALGGKKTVKTVMEFDADFGDLVARTKVVRTEYDKINTAVRKRAQIEKGSMTSLRGQLRQASQVRDQYARLADDGKTVNNNWKVANDEVKRLNLEIAKASGKWLDMAKAKLGGGAGNILSMANAFSQIGFAVQGAVQGLQAINGAIQPLINRQRQVEGLSLALQGFGMNTDEAGQIMNNAKVQAFTYGASLTQLEMGYKRVAPAVMNAGGSMQDVSDVMASISARTTTLGLNSEQTGRYIEAFAQVMGKGKLQGEELNQQFSELDGALRGQIGNYLKATQGIGDLSEAMKNGEVTADLFLEAFNAISEDMRNNLAGAVGEVQTRLDDLNVAQVTNIVNTLNTISMDSLRESLGPIGESFKRIWVSMSQFFAAVTTNMPGIKSFMTNFFKGIGIALDVAIRGFLTGLTVILKAIDTVLGALGGAIEWAMKNIPGLKQLYEGAANGLESLGDQFNKGTDMILQFGDGTINTADKLSTLDGRILALKNKFEEGKIGPEEYTKALGELEAQVAQQLDLAELDKLQQKIKDIKQELKLAQEDNAQAKSVFKQEQEELNALKAGVKTYFGELYTQLDQAKQRVNSRYDAEKQAIKDAQAAAKSRHTAEMADLEAMNAKKQEVLQSEIDALGAKTPAEEKLAQLRRQEIVDKLKSSGLSEREKLELQAQLERLDAQKQIEEKQLQLKKEKENAAKAEAALQAKQKTEMEALKDEEKELARVRKEDLNEIKDKKSALKDEEKAILDLFKDQEKEMNLQGETLEDITNKVRNQKIAYDDAKSAVDRTTDAVSTLKTRLGEATSQARQLKQAIDSANSAKSGGGTGGTSGGQGGAPTFRAAGGPVTGGKDYTVNELGKEGFVSRSGRVSEIKAPSWGNWKAPSSGSVIPAHVWAQIKAQQALGGSQEVAAGMSGTGSLISAIRGMGGGGSRDTINNTITISSDNPQQALQETLIQTRRDKRRRYH